MTNKNTHKEKKYDFDFIIVKNIVKICIFFKLMCKTNMELVKNYRKLL